MVFTFVPFSLLYRKMSNFLISSRSQDTILINGIFDGLFFWGIMISRRLFIFFQVTSGFLLVFFLHIFFYFSATITEFGKNALELSSLSCLFYGTFFFQMLRVFCSFLWVSRKTDEVKITLGNYILQNFQTPTLKKFFPLNFIVESNL